MIYMHTETSRGMHDVYDMTKREGPPCVLFAQWCLCAFVCDFGHVSVHVGVKGHCVGGQQGLCEGSCGMLFWAWWDELSRKGQGEKVQKTSKHQPPYKRRSSLTGPLHGHTHTQTHSGIAPWPLVLNHGARNCVFFWLADWQPTVMWSWCHMTGLSLCSCQGSEVMAVMSQNTTTTTRLQDVMLHKEKNNAYLTLDSQHKPVSLWCDPSSSPIVWTVIII